MTVVRMKIQERLSTTHLKSLGDVHVSPQEREAAGRVSPVHQRPQTGRGAVVRPKGKRRGEGGGGADQKFDVNVRLSPRALARTRQPAGKSRTVNLGGLHWAGGVAPGGGRGARLLPELLLDRTPVPERR